MQGSQRCRTITGSVRRALAGAILVGVSLAALAAAPQARRSTEVLSRTYTVDRKYRSMQGPQSTQEVRLDPSPLPELLWITGYRAVMVGEDGSAPMPQEFMCHSNLDIDMKRHRVLFGWKKFPSSRLFTLSQGQFEIRFPDGFGIPVLSTEPLSLTTQVLNHNVEGRTFQVRHKVAIDYVRDSDAERPMKPLYMSAANGLVLVEGDTGHYGVEHPTEEEHGSGCLVGQPAMGRVQEDEFGRKFSGHWVVPPGRQENRTLVTEWMNLRFDTTVHYIAVHLHPFAESLELRDLTSGTTIFKSRARGPADRIGLDHVDAFASAEGVPVYKDHQYELVSVYENTSGVEQDSMAVMYLYLLDREFRKPDLLDLADSPGDAAPRRLGEGM
jgi:hypothetical protein